MDVLRRAARLAGAWLAMVCSPVALVAQEPAPPLAQWHHTAWTARDGLTGRPLNLAQTADGFLWIGTTGGLFRFDGVEFERVQPDNGEMPNVTVSALAAVPDGSLWIGYTRGGVTRLGADGRATHYDRDDGLPFGNVRSIARTDDGAVWLAVVGGLARFADGRWQRVRDDWNYPGGSAATLFVDRAGGLWLGGATPDGLHFLPKGSRRFELVAAGIAAENITRAVDGTILVGDSTKPLLHGVRPRGDGGFDVRVVADIAVAAVAADPDGSVWVAGLGLSRLIPRSDGLGGLVQGAPGIDRFSPAEGLSGSVARDVLVDREGNTWVATDAGLDRLRRRNLTWTQPRDNSLSTSLVAGPGLEIWASWLNNGVRRVEDWRPVPDLPTGVTWGQRTSDDTLLVGGGGRLWRWRDGSFSPIAPPPELSDKKMRFSVASATVDRSGRLWASVNGAGQFRLEGDTWTFVPVLPGRPDLTALDAHTGEDGRVWLAYQDSLAVIDGSHTRVFPASEIGVGTLRAIGGRAGLVWVGGEKGLAVLRDDRFLALRMADGTSPGSVSSLLATAQHGLWVTASARIVHLPQAEIDRLLSDPGHRVAFDVFDLISDLPEPLQDHQSQTAIEDGTGTIWFVTQHHLAKLDPRRIRRNALPPPVVVRTLTADNRPYPARGHVLVPALTRSITIDYTALSLTIPERVRFRYRLEGWETEWHVGQHRSMSYTDLRPGAYSFRVLACNNDGVWNETGAVLAFTVLPAWYQTVWFRALVVVSLAGALVVFYRLRVRRVTVELAARFDERLAERTRLARELHDTLVQTVQGSRMVASHAVAHLDDPVGTRRDLERLSGWLDQAVQEARAALNALRPSDVEANDLAAAFRRMTEEAGGPDAPAISVSMRGTVRALHPVVQDEVCAIAQEAMRNARAHARATRLNVEIEYGRDFVLLVADNGIGMDQAVLDAGRPEHFGLAGMRERAANMRASMSITSSAAGTSLRLVVPGRLAFRER